PLAFASSLGGVLTLIGTPPNLVASNMLVENDLDAMHFFSFTPIGIVALTSGVIFMVTIGKRLLPDHSVADIVENNTNPSKLVGLYRVHPLLHTFEVTARSPLNGKQLKELQLTNKYNITVVSIESTEKGRITKFEFISNITTEDSSY